MASDDNMDFANQSYAKFLSMLKVGTVLTAIVTIIVVALIA